MKRGRFGIYFVETGANQRAGTVTYDREGSSVALARPEDFDWDHNFRDADWFHITGITPALTSNSGGALESVRQARSRGLKVSCDLNFRKKLWNWRPGTSSTDLARETTCWLVPHVDVLIANEEDADLALGIYATASNVEEGKLNLAGYEHVVTNRHGVSQPATSGHHLTRQPFRRSQSLGSLAVRCGVESGAFRTDR